MSGRRGATNMHVLRLVVAGALVHAGSAALHDAGRVAAGRVAVHKPQALPPTSGASMSTATRHLDAGAVVAYPRRMTAKPGYKTTEFWTVVFTALVQVANLSGAWDYMSNWHSGLVLAIVTAAYTASRGLAKRPG